MLMARLLDTSATHRKMFNHGPAGRWVAQRIYRDNGDEVINVHELNTDDCIWLSFGEPFISPHSKWCSLVATQISDLLMSVLRTGKAVITLLLCHSGKSIKTSLRYFHVKHMITL